MSYEAGIARRKNVMATAMKNILTIAAVTPTFYYFGWWIYNCNQPGLPIGPNSSDFTAGACQGGIPWSDAFGPNLTNNINLIFFLAFLLFSWTAASIMSGALLERVRLSAYLVLAALLGSVVWILDAAWGWSAGGWLTLRFGFHDSIASGSSTAWPARSRSACCSTSARGSASTRRTGWPGPSDPTTCTSRCWG